MKLPTKKRIKEYIILGIINTGVVYLIYTPYVILWLNLDFNQYIRWLTGGLPYSLLTSWFFALVIIKSKKRLFPEIKT